jgi:hypothetical protein
MAVDVGAHSEGGARLPVLGTRYPVAFLTNNPQTEDWIVRLIWLALPLEYFLLTILPGGARRLEFLPVLFLTSASIVCIFIVSAMLARFRTRGESYAIRFRTWAVALAFSWCVTLIVLALGHFIFYPIQQRAKFDPVSISVDGLSYILCGDGCEKFPGANFQTLLIYFVYTSIAAIVVVLFSKWWRRGLKNNATYEDDSPNAIAVILFTTLIISVMHIAGNSLGVDWTQPPLPR